MAARITAVCEAVVARLEARLAPVPPDAVSRAYLPEVGEGPRGKWPDGRRVYVFPDGYSQVATATRAEDTDEYRVAVVVAERYDGPGPVPAGWVDERVDWVEQLVEDLGDARGEYLLGTLRPEAAEVSQVYDPVLLRQTPGGFVSEVLLTYREERG